MDFQTYVKDSLLRYDLAPKTDMDLTGERYKSMSRYNRFLERIK